MYTKEKIIAIYKELRKEYEPYTLKILDDLNKGGAIDRPISQSALESDCITAEQARDLFLMYDCAIISACRAVHQATADEDMKRNKRNSEELQNMLQELGLQYIVVDGCYREKFEDEASHEDSCFVYADPAKGTDFFLKMYELAECYGQDSFLYKCAGMTWRAFEVHTNEDTRNEMNFKLVGKLKLNLPPIGPYTNLTEGRITFVVNEQEELDDTTIPPVASTKPVSRVKAKKKRFLNPQPGNMVFKTNGEICIGRYTIGTWQKVGVRKFIATLDNRSKTNLIGKSQKNLRSDIAKACKNGITGKFYNV